jgi:hypothetical protein
MLNKRGKAGLHRCDEAGVPVRIPMRPDAMAQQQCAGIVIDAIAMIAVGNAVNRVLKQPVSSHIAAK